MDLNGITQIISQLGFPIAVCLIAFWYINKLDNKHTQEVAELRKSLENNTVAITELVTLFNKMTSGGDV